MYSLTFNTLQKTVLIKFMHTKQIFKKGFNENAWPIFSKIFYNYKYDKYIPLHTNI